MLQIILITALILEFSVYVFLGFKCWDSPLSLLYIVPLVLSIMVVVRMLMALPSYCVAGILRSRDKNQQPWGDSLLALAKEIDARAMAFSLSQPFHQWLMPEVAGNKHATNDAAPVLLVHGYASNRGMFIRLRSRLIAAGTGPIYTLNLALLFDSIDETVPLLAARIEQICAETKSEQIIIVAHSMGGLVTRRLMANMGHAGRIKRLITIGSPHHGSQMAAFSTGNCVKEIRPRSNWLTALELAEAGIEKPPTLSIYTLNDDLVYPPESSILEWENSENVPMSGVGHVSLLASEAVAERVLAEIKKAI